MPTIPDKKNLRTGWTTGICSAAAAKAAMIALRTQEMIREVEVTLPIGKKHRFPVAHCEWISQAATCVVVKEAGDDPDCTDGAHLTASVSWTDEVGTVSLSGGEGVATVTKAGLGLEVGSSAINPVPKKNIREMVIEGAEDALQSAGLRVVISVPEGIEMAKQTLNHRLGLIGGISILGTTGIVRPYSTAAFKVSIAQAIDVAVGEGLDTLVFTTGGKSEGYLMKETGLPGSSYIQMGDFVGYSLKKAAKEKIRKVIIGGMPGKMSKIAKGEMQTHAAGSRVDLGFLADIAREVGAPAEIVEEISTANTARHVQEIVAREQVDGFWDRLALKVCENCRKQVKNSFIVECVLVDFGGSVIGRTLLDA